ncbi:hypothetical protein T459_19451 [Capsicum annuum]|uniref:Uncharacterized protein n=1 Tax=Capsicum annuum TaxID=4072 RepID=A0A2G2Z1R8_CAPAN|nr:hypothetical protein T459_19451 [Capsicum annuum]
MVKQKGREDKLNVKDEWALTQVQNLQIRHVYAALILYGYFLKSASLRHHLKQNLGSLRYWKECNKVDLLISKLTVWDDDVVSRDLYCAFFFGLRIYLSLNLCLAYGNSGWLLDLATFH